MRENPNFIRDIITNRELSGKIKDKYFKDRLVIICALPKSASSVIGSCIVELSSEKSAKGRRYASYMVANKINNRLGIETMNSVMLGLPGETRETIKKTVDYLCKAKDVHIIGYGIASPYPGTELYDWAIKGLYGLKLLSKDFSKFQREPFVYSCSGFFCCVVFF